ncbi:M13 family metallopeptidase [Solimicrobium silvestre]|uniref:Putative metalloendopeptidase n=1 Tax=Solimicrobium silvestre TaxID=2099400 RepID=A0A2S9GZH5_9BURK|nr:M13 family metallopeptidase [Solimicrobium silvestre]PRC93139.1 putative metalloendopeptidase [Solimicrobium silvestre]
MKQLTKRFALSAIVLALSSASLYAATPATAETTSSVAALPSGIEKANIDGTVRIQDDFYRHVNGTWLKTTEIPADKSRWGSFNVLADAVLPQMQGIIETLSKDPNIAPGTDAQKVSDLYASYMDTTTIDALGLKPLDATFAQIDAVSDKNQIPTLIAYLNRVGITAPYGFGIHQDAKDSTKYIVDLGQSGLGLPDRDYYLKDDDAKLKSARDAYQKHIEKMLGMAGDAKAADSAAAIIKLETALAQVQWSKVEQRDPVKGYNKIELAKLNALTPDHDFLSYLKAVGVDGKITYVIVSQPSYFTGFAKVMQDTPLATWKTYFKWHALSDNSSLLPANFADEHFAFYSTTLRGVPQQEVRWKRGVRMADGDMGEALGKIYVSKYFPPEYKARMEKLVDNLLAAYKQSVTKLDWMSPATKKEAQAKLATFMPKIGYPSKWRDYSALTIKKDDLIGNSMRANEFATQFEINKLGQPIDRAEWGMTPQTVNAYYNPELNEIVFPAAILQPPFFNANADDAVNYGAIGAVIGHEISHGFDDQGSQYDEKGNLRDWWTKQDHKKFAAKTAALVKQYNSFSPLPGYFVNGELTLGENIADNSGLAIAFKAYKISLNGKPAPVIDGFTGEQRFYMGFGQVWQSKSRDAATLVQIKTDPHSPAEFRGNGTVQNQPEFYKAFDVKKGDKMYVAPANRVIIW